MDVVVLAYDEGDDLGDEEDDSDDEDEVLDEEVQGINMFILFLDSILCVSVYYF